MDYPLSNPIYSLLWACNSVGRVLPLQGRSREFESHQVHQYARIVQLVEQGLHTAWVGGSNPSSGTKSESAINLVMVRVTIECPATANNNRYWCVICGGKLTDSAVTLFQGLNVKKYMVP